MYGADPGHNKTARIGIDLYNSPLVSNEIAEFCSALTRKYGTHIEFDKDQKLVKGSFNTGVIKRPIIWAVGLGNLSLASNYESLITYSSAKKPTTPILIDYIGYLTFCNESFFKKITKTLPHVTGKRWIPFYWPNIAQCWITTFIESGLKLAGVFFTQLTRKGFWSWANDILKISTKKFGPEPGDWQLSTTWTRTKRSFAALGIFSLWICSIVPPVLWLIGQSFYLAANAISYVRHLVDAVFELGMTLTSWIWVTLSFCLPSNRRLVWSDFSPIVALKQIVLNLLLLIPIAIVIAMALIPGWGQAAAPAMMTLLDHAALWIQGLVCAMLFAPVAQFTSGVIHGVSHWIERCMIPPQQIEHVSMDSQGNTRASHSPGALQRQLSVDRRLQVDPNAEHSAKTNGFDSPTGQDGTASLLGNFGIHSETDADNNPPDYGATGHNNTGRDDRTDSHTLSLSPSSRTSQVPNTP